MNNHLIKFNDMPWQTPGEGIRYKAFRSGNQQVRLVEFSHGFIEEDWCIKGHIAYVLDGSFKTDYNGRVEQYYAGDTVFISQGENDKHKAILEKGEKVLLLLFEVI